MGGGGGNCPWDIYLVGANIPGTTTWGATIPGTTAWGAGIPEATTGGYCPWDNYLGGGGQLSLGQLPGGGNYSWDNDLGTTAHGTTTGGQLSLV